MVGLWFMNFEVYTTTENVGKVNMSGHIWIYSREERLSVLDTKLRAACEGDPKWNQLHDEENLQAEEYNRLLEEIEKLKKTNAESKQVKISKLSQRVAYSKSYVAYHKQLQRQSELEKSYLEDNLKAPTSQQQRERIQRRLKNVDGYIQSCKGSVNNWEEEANKYGEKLKLLDPTIKEEEENRRLLKEGLKEGVVKMRYIVCITVGLPGVGKTCLKFLLMGQPLPELRSSTICAESPIRIEVQVRAISDIKLRASGEQWIEVDNEGMLEIVARMIILAVEQHPTSRRFQFWDTTDKPIGELEQCGSVEQEAKENPLSRFVCWIKTCGHKQTFQPPKDSHDAKLSAVVADPQRDICQTAVNAIMDKLVQIITRLRNEFKKPGEGSIQPSRSLLESIWVYLSDCGGQPQYHELLPLFIQHISAALCVLRLPDQLDQVQAVEYYSENQLLGVAQQSQFTAKDTIQCLINTIQSFPTKGQKPKIILVGTHRDKLEEKAPVIHSQETSADHASLPLESLEEKDDQLREMLEPEFSNQLVYCSKDMKQLLFPLNTLNPDKTDRAKAKVIRKAVENSPAQELEVPIWWYIFEQLLQELAKRLGRKILSKAECLEIANMLGFKERALEAALKFFDELNVIKYSPNVLPNVIFTDSQVPLDKVSELVRESYLLRGYTTGEQLNSDSTPGEGKWRHFRDHGVVSPELMRKFPSHYVPGIFTIDDLSILLKELLVFAPIPTPNWTKPTPGKSSAILPQESPPTTTPEKSEPHFVMPASLVTLSEAELAKQRTSSPMAAALLVKFPKGSRRSGVFCCFAVHLIRHCGWELLLDANVPLYRNCIKFCLKKTSPPCTVTVIDSNSFIEVYANVSAQATALHCARLLPIIKGSIFGGIAAACRALKYKETYPEIGFICPHYEDSMSEKPKLHSASVSHDNEFWCCDDDTSISGLLQGRHHVWFGEVTDDNTTATSPHAPSQVAPPKEPALPVVETRPMSVAQSKTNLLSPGLSPPPAIATSSELSSSAVKTKSDDIAQSQANLLSPELSPPPAMATFSEFSSPAVKTRSLTDDVVQSQANIYTVPSGSLTQATAVTAPTQSTPPSASHLPHIPEYVSISSSRVTEKQNDMSKPTSFNLTMITWKNERGEAMKYGLKQSIMHKWRDIGDLVVPWQQLEVWGREKDAKACCTAVLSYWLVHPSRNYPATWEGLYELLQDSELSQVATELKQAVDNAI